MNKENNTGNVQETDSTCHNAKTKAHGQVRKFTMPRVGKCSREPNISERSYYKNTLLSTNQDICWELLISYGWLQGHECMSLC